jgi:hypothetical protein
MLDLDPGYVLASMLVSGIGYVLFMYGRKQRRFPHAATGIVLLIYPYFVTNIGMMFALGAVLLGLLFALVRMGI